MKEIRLKYITFVNFKSFTNKRIDFGKDTEICGRNATGKTTVFDGFTWCLFGKDSTDRKQFNVKTLDGDGNAIPKLPHEVEVGLEVDGTGIVLTRRYKEKWIGSGTPSERFAGHEEERLYDGVPLSVAEWKERISSLIDEEMFKYATNPKYFTSQKPDVQRRMLFKMAGGLADDDVAATDASFRGLLDTVRGKSIEEYRREVKSALDRVTKEKESIPARIDERRRDAVAPEDWGALESELAGLGKELGSVEAAMRDKARAISDADKERVAAAREVSKIKKKITERKLAIEEAAHSSYEEAVGEIVKMDRKMSSFSEEADFHKKMIAGYEADISSREEERKRLLAEYGRISAETVSFDGIELVCPTCKRPYDTDDVESRKREMEERFNADKSRRIGDNVAKGKRAAQEIEELKLKIDAQNNYLKSVGSRISELKEALKSPLPEEPAYEELVATDGEYQRLSKALEDAQDRLNSLPEAADDGELQMRRSDVLARIDMVKTRLAKRGVIEANEARIAELGRQLRANGEEEARLKGILDTIAEFGKTRARMLSDKVNGLFAIVKFKLFETQVNGEEKETCEATVDGVPYSDVNAAGKTLAGLDIIAAIQRHMGVSAPIFIDNAEGISDYPGSVMGQLGQVVKLRVTDDDELFVR